LLLSREVLLISLTLLKKSADRPSTRGPKRANHIRKIYALAPSEDVRKYVVKRVVPGKNGKKDRIKSPKIQRLVTPVRRQRKKRLLKLKRARHEKATTDATEYAKLLDERRVASRVAELSKKRERKSEHKSVKSEKTKPVETKAVAKTVTKPVAKTQPEKKVTTKKTQTDTKK